MNHSKAYIKYCNHKRKHNLRLSFLALALLLVSIITMTYCWIEGATSISIVNENNDILVNDISELKQYTLDEEYTTNSIKLSDYIVNKENLYLSPAQMKSGVLQIKEGTSTYRNANTNDIGNNYIEFDVKIKVNNENKFSFTPDSAISINGDKTNPINVALKLDNTIVGQFDSDLTQIGTSTSREAFIISDTDLHNLKVMIWYDDAIAKSTSFNGTGSTVNFDFELVAADNLTSLTFVDKTNSQTAQNLASSYTMKVAVTINGNVTEYPLTKGSDNSYTSGEVIPMSGLSTAEFRCYSGSTLKSKWTASNAVAEGTYTAYGNFSTTGGTGTWNDVVPVNFVDSSIDTSFNTGSNHVTITNGVDTLCYNMYYNSTSKTWSAFVPVETFTGNKTLYFNSRSTAANSDSVNYCVAPDSFATTPTNPTFTVYGSTTTVASGGDIEYIGKWCTGYDTITVRSYNSTITAVEDNFWVSFDGKQTYYKAKYDSSTGYWTFNVPNDDITTLDFKAGTYLFNGTNREKTGEDYIYSITSTTVGSWTYVKKVNITVNACNYADVTASYTTTSGAVITISEGQTAQVSEGTVLTLDANMSSGISANSSNGHKFSKFTVNSTEYTTNGQTVKVGTTDLIISTTTAPYDFYIGGEGFEGWTGSWDENNKLMSYDSNTNSVSATIVNSVATDAKFKIAMDGFNNRNNSDYSVTLNTPTLVKSGNITSAELDTTGKEEDTCVYIDAAKGSTITVTYKLDTHTITVNGVAPANPTYTLYLNNIAGWSSPVAHFWENGGADGTTWPGNSMTKVSGNIWKIELTSNYDRIIFSNNGESQTGDLIVPGDSYIYNNSTGSWTAYDPDDYATKTITVGVVSHIYNSADIPNYMVHYWGGSTAGDASCTSLGTTKSKNVGYWSTAQTFYMFTAEIPADSTGFKFRIGDRWFGGDGDASTKNTVYVFSYNDNQGSADKAVYTKE